MEGPYAGSEVAVRKPASMAFTDGVNRSVAESFLFRMIVSFPTRNRRLCFIGFPLPFSLATKSTLIHICLE